VALDLSKIIGSIQFKIGQADVVISNNPAQDTDENKLQGLKNYRDELLVIIHGVSEEIDKLEGN